MEHRDPGPDSVDHRVTALRGILNAWDPIGIIEDGEPADEYDCLIAPVLDLVAHGAGPREVETFLRTELADHFGLDPERHAAGVEAVAHDAVDLRTRDGG
ncbi:hypothetical protein I4I73_17635 [Pseudonocardia sp. KRD-184]|uniref:DUF1871 family protein n=1 Tax=Pseudonocardia oceani TaxID=2792013 RepID=A0ABS6UE02_9PSEU|nr:hypothetical protein [Pseudonocardia oceani]MBW0090676.1 hypothetical protein [Pseudonocardia oceani]MBW0097804.1 hypothetical protein [Pseudonocardia oceani]MBW0112956.1 hypothetical protein [Pseudonocardia oceani]MBW0121990.1 hypothetical protein [Pseudonocardia oceani]MBW0130480.1 hypothetical protein [Pseudonocardia oceani]